jgi:hypothetical protein
MGWVVAHHRIEGANRAVPTLGGGQSPPGSDDVTQCLGVGESLLDG